MNETHNNTGDCCSLSSGFQGVADNMDCCASYSIVCTKRRRLSLVLSMLLALYSIRTLYEHVKPEGSLGVFRFGDLLPSRPIMYDASYDWSVGGNEIRQYETFMKMNPDFDFHVVSNASTLQYDPGYSYNVKQVEIGTVGQSRGVCVRIDERYKKTSTSGGSCFYAFSETAASTTRQMCSFWDFFNGTYIVWCPPMIGELCMNISILLQHTNFTAYNSCSHPMHHTIWRGAACSHDRDDVDKPSGSRQLVSHVTSLPKSPVLWQETANKRYSILTRSNRKFKPFDKSALCARVKTFRKLIMVGSSHMRFKADYLIWKCYQLPSNLSARHHSLTVGNIHFIWRSHGRHFVTLLEKELSRDKLDRNDVVLTQTGAHDMAYNGLPSTLETMTHSYVQVIKELKRRSVQIGFQLMVITSPPVADDKPQYARGSRNCCAMSVVVHKLQKALLPLDVDIFDEFSVILPQQRKAACTGHYICYKFGRNRTITIQGDVGELSLLLLMEQVSHGIK